MTELGNVFDAASAPKDAARGPDLEHAVQVPRSALGREDGWVVQVPTVFECDGQQVQRAIEPDMRGEGVRLHLAAGLPDRAKLRLRGQGGVHPGGVPGDLLVSIEVVEDPPMVWRRPRVAIAIATLALACAVAIGWALGL